jgi:hypothetical protein
VVCSHRTSPAGYTCRSCEECPPGGGPFMHFRTSFVGFWGQIVPFATPQPRNPATPQPPETLIETGVVVAHEAVMVIETGVVAGISASRSPLLQSRWRNRPEGSPLLQSRWPPGRQPLPQSPIANRQSPIANRHSPIANRQSPIATLGDRHQPKLPEWQQPEWSGWPCVSG